MPDTCAILPIKDFRRAKTRLRPVLRQSECGTVARLLAIDMLDNLRAVASIKRILVVGQGDDHARLARMYDCDYVSDDPALDISSNLTRIAQRPEQAGEEALLYIPTDLAFATYEDISQLLEGAERDITICRAVRDGGTNALLAFPPGQVEFSFGPDSCKRHALAATSGKRSVRILDDAAFQRDIDVPDDLVRLCRGGPDGNLVEYLQNSQLAARLTSLMPESLAS